MYGTRLVITEASNPSNILLPKVRRLNLIFVPALITLVLFETIYNNQLTMSFVYKFKWLHNRKARVHSLLQ